MLSQVTSFRCPNCNEFINTDADTCRFCFAPVNRGEAEAAAEVQTKVNRACSDASYIRIVAGAMLAFLGISYVPFIGGVGACGFGITVLAVPVMLLLWQSRFGKLETDDPDFTSARKTKNTAFIIWLVAVPLKILIEVAITYLDVNNPE